MLKRLLKRPKPLQNKGFSHPLPWMNMLMDKERVDYRGVPTYVCPCGYDMFLIAAVFDGDTQQPGMYMLDGVCTHCTFERAQFFHDDCVGCDCQHVVGESLHD